MSAARKLPSAFGGFTIIEIVIASSIALFVFLVGYGAISSTVSASNISSARIRDTENARLFFNMLDRDLKSAYPGPTYMIKKTPVPLISATSYTAQPAGNNPILLSELAGKSDILQFYCRTDHSPDHSAIVPEPPEAILYVQYCYNRIDNTICRRYTAYDPDPTVSPVPVDQNPAFDPLNITGTSATQWAIFDNVTLLKFDYQQWYAPQKIFVLPGDSRFVSADSIKVTIQFGDARNEYLNKFNHDPNRNTSVYRSYTKVFPIPSSFTQ